MNGKFNFVFAFFLFLFSFFRFVLLKFGRECEFVDRTIILLKNTIENNWIKYSANRDVHKIIKKIQFHVVYVFNQKRNRDHEKLLNLFVVNVQKQKSSFILNNQSIRQTNHRITQLPTLLLFKNIVGVLRTILVHFSGRGLKILPSIDINILSRCRCGARKLCPSLPHYLIKVQIFDE